jgi:hypothetical protein
MNQEDIRRRVSETRPRDSWELVWSLILLLEDIRDNALPAGSLWIQDIDEALDEVKGADLN